MKVYWKYYVFPFLYGVIFSWYGSFHSEKKIQIWEMIAQINGGYLAEINPRSVSGLLLLYMPFFLYTLIFSTYIYRHFCNSSVYVFSRCENRVRWYFSEIAKLFGFTALQVLMVPCGYVFTAVLGNRLSLSVGPIWVIAWYLSLYTLWCFHMVLLANIVSILKGSVVGNTVAIGMQILSTVALLQIDSRHLTGKNVQRLIWNPNAYLVADWYNIKWNGEKLFGVMKYGLSIAKGYLVTGIICIAVVLFGMFVVQRIDIIQNNKEV